MQSKRGFSLLETLLYLGIFAIIGGSLFGILTNVVRISTREVSGDEVSSQLQFAMETVSRLVRESSAIETETTATTTLKLRMQNPALDPTCIFMENGVLKLSQGPDAYQPQSCVATATNLTTDKIIVDSAFFKRVEFSGGHDQVAIDLQFSNTATGANKISRALRSGISRASAATFDSDLLPSSDAQYEVGASLLGGKRWKNVALSGVLYLGNAAVDPTGANGAIYYNTGTSVFRGYINGAWTDIASGASLWTPSGPNMYSGVSGNVGIGVVAPTYKLEVNGNSANSTGVWAVRSDERLKRDIAPINNALQTVMALQGVGFNWKDDDKNDQFGRVMGFIAQDVENVLPQWVKTDADGYKRIETIGMDALLVESIKEQQKIIKDQEKRIANLEQQLTK